MVKVFVSFSLLPPEKVGEDGEVMTGWIEGVGRQHGRGDQEIDVMVEVVGV